MTIIQILNVLVPKLDILFSTGLLPMASFGGAV
jgi:hypothetical protein